LIEERDLHLIKETKLRDKRKMEKQNNKNKYLK